MEQIYPGSASIPAGNLRCISSNTQGARSVGGLHIAGEIGGGVFNPVATPYSHGYDDNGNSKGTVTHVLDISDHVEAMHGSNDSRSAMKSVTMTSFAQDHPWQFFLRYPGLETETTEGFYAYDSRYNVTTPHQFHFLDSMSHGASMYANGDPINFVDPRGRSAAQIWNAVGSASGANGWMAGLINSQPEISLYGSLGSSNANNGNLNDWGQLSQSQSSINYDMPDINNLDSWSSIENYYAGTPADRALNQSISSKIVLGALNVVTSSLPGFESRVMPSGRVVTTDASTSQQAWNATSLLLPEVFGVLGTEGRIISNELRLSTRTDEAVFWSGIGRNGTGPTKAQQWVAEHGGSTLETTLADRGIRLPVFDRNNPASVAAWDQASERFAASAAGDVRVLQTEKVRLDSVWVRKEFPALKANPKVNSIKAVNPETGVETLLWKR